jgi:hypothetical protein
MGFAVTTAGALLLSYEEKEGLKDSKLIAVAWGANQKDEESQTLSRDV